MTQAKQPVTLEELHQQLNTFVAQDADHAIRADYARRPGLAGIRYYEDPLIGCAAADDPYFLTLKSDPQIYGPFFRLPAEWLPGARTVISMFFPFTQAIRDSNRADPREPSDEWLHGRIEGQAFLEKTTRMLAGYLASKGYQAVIPCQSKDFAVRRQPEKSDKGMPPFVSNWSERHVAYTAGLGTFSLSKHLITRKGVCGRFASIVTDAELPVTRRAYTEPFAYCVNCGMCARRCPAKAIKVPEHATTDNLARGKDNRICSAYLQGITERYKPYYGCGKCQLGGPCEHGIPGQNQ